ncbi:hypothetical protein [Streptomyces sp. NPDC002580]|uniref:hypothetical protein n=1 Tax=Streptomyces sp. NPDC002580 TaxID=3364653 RepID=UPI003678A66D
MNEKPDGWRIAYSGTSDNAMLIGLAAASDRDAWAVGTTLDRDPESFFLHYDGRRWRDYDAATELPVLTRLSAQHPRLQSSGPDNTWLFAGDPRKDLAVVVVRWDGRRWREIPSPPGRVAERYQDAAVFAPDDVWMLAGPATAPGRWPAEARTIWHWNGVRWTGVRLPAVATAIAGQAPDDIWAVGSTPGKEVFDVRRPEPAAMHYDGHAWRLTSFPHFDPPAPAGPGDDHGAELRDVVTAGPDGAWAVGTQSYRGDEPDEGDDEAPVVAHWDGSRWEKRPRAPYDVTRPVAWDGGRGLLGPSTRLRVDGTVDPVAAPPLMPGKSGEITEFDRGQRLELFSLVQVPGTRQVWGAGDISARGVEEFNFQRPVIVAYMRPPDQT